MKSRLLVSQKMLAVKTCYNGKRLRNASGTSGMNVSYPLEKLGTVRKDRKKGQLT